VDNAQQIQMASQLIRIGSPKREIFTHLLIYLIILDDGNAASTRDLQVHARESKEREDESIEQRAMRRADALCRLAIDASSMR
jgi:hypothetical protein